MTAATFAATATSDPPTAAPPAPEAVAPTPAADPAPTPEVPEPLAPNPMVGRDGAAAALGAPLKSARPMGRGSTASPLNALRCRFCVSARRAQSRHSARCSSSRRRSFRESLPSSCFDMASSALWHVTRFSSSSASERRARNRSVSSAEVERPSSAAISLYDRPSSSRSTSASRCAGGIRWRARTSSSSSMSSSSDAASGTSWTSSTSVGREAAWRQRCRTTFCAIAMSQLDGLCGTSPRSSARSAFTNVVWVTSSASAWFPRTAYV